MDKFIANAYPFNQTALINFCANKCTHQPNRFLSNKEAFYICSPACETDHNNAHPEIKYMTRFLVFFDFGKDTYFVIVKANTYGQAIDHVKWMIPMSKNHTICMI